MAEEEDVGVMIIDKLEQLPDNPGRLFLLDAGGEGQERDISFSRAMARNPETLLASVDTLSHSSKGLTEGDYILELKVHKDTGLLTTAMRYAMDHFRVKATSRSKLELVEMGAV